MPHWPDLQKSFAKALFDPTCPAPTGMIAANGSSAETRFNVYRNNVAIGLRNALRESFPVVCRLVGDDFFTAMALEYARAEPPRSPVMLWYGSTFPDFIERFAPAAALPYLADVARIERAWLEAYHAADAEGMERLAFQGTAPALLPLATLKIHPALRIVRSRHAALSIWGHHLVEAAPTALELPAGGEDVWIFRREAEVEIRAIPPGGACFIQALQLGLPILTAFEDALEEDAQFDLAAHLSALLESGAVTGFEMAGMEDIEEIGALDEQT